MTVRMRRRRRPRRPVSPLAIALGAACLVLCVVAGGILRAEWRATVIAQAVADRSAAAGDTVLAAYGDVPPAQLAPRAAAPLAQLALNAARLARSPELRALDTARATALIAYLVRHRPDWEATLLLVTQREMLRTGDVTPLACSAFAASYRVRPFYPAAAIWRIAFARLYWQRLDPAARRAAIEEAVWRTRFDGGQRPAMERLLGDSPAGVAYELRMASVDHGVA